MRAYGLAAGVLAALLALDLNLGAQTTGACSIETIAGMARSPVGDGAPAVDAELYDPSEARRGADGLLYIADTGHRLVRRVRRDGVIETVAGGGDRSVDLNPIPATEAALAKPTSLTIAPDGTLYFVDLEYILRVDTEGSIVRFAGRIPEGGYVCRFVLGTFRSCGPVDEDGAATDIFFGPDLKITTDDVGNLYAASPGTHLVRKVSPDGAATTIAGTGAPDFFPTDGVLATASTVTSPTDVAVDSNGFVYIGAGGRRHRVRRVRPDGIIETYLQSGGRRPDGTPQSQATTTDSRHIEVDDSGRLHWWELSVIRRVRDGIIESLPVPEQGFVSPSFSFDENGNMYVSRNHLIGVFSADRPFEVVAGVGGRASRGDGGPAIDARISRVAGMGAHGGSLYFADRGFHRVRVIDTNGRITTAAGSGETGRPIAGIPAADSPLFQPHGIAVDDTGALYVGVDRQVLRVDATGTTAVMAGSGQPFCNGSACGDGGPAVDATLSSVEDVEVDGQGNVYLLDGAPRGRVRIVSVDGEINGVDLGPDSESIDVTAIHIDTGDNLIVAGRSGQDEVVRRRTPEGSVATIAGAQGFVGFATAITSDSVGSLYFVGGPGNCSQNHIKRLTPDGELDTIAGSTDPPTCFNSTGDGGPASDATLGRISSMAVDATNNLYLGERGLNRIRRIRRVDLCPSVGLPTLVSGAIRNGASFEQTHLSPGLIVSGFGRGLGPSELVVSQLNEQDMLPGEVGGTRLLVDGIPAPMLFTSSAQIGAIVPFGIVGTTNVVGVTTASIEVEFRGSRSELQRLPVSPASPGIFTLDASGSGLGAILNQDQTINGPNNPARQNSIVTLYATGFGLMDPPAVDGAISGTLLARPILPVEVQFNQREADLLYVGSAPGLVSGVVQLNARLPDGLDATRPVRVHIQIEGRFSRPVDMIVAGP